MRAKRTNNPLRLAVAGFEPLESRRMLAAHIAGSPTGYSTIQAAVNAATAGATITVDAGNYAELVTVNKPLTIRGAQAGIDARGSVREASNNETIVTGATTTGGISEAFHITASDVTIDGFTIQGETVQTYNLSAGIVIAPGVAGTHILNNIVQNNVSGLFLANTSASDAAVVQYNVFQSNNNAGSNGGRGIYTDETISGGNLTNVTIDSNAFLYNFGGAGTTGLESAIALEATVANAQSNIRITNNVIDGNGKAILAFNATNLLITGNTVTNNQDWYSGALRFEGNDNTVTITGNTVYNNTGPAVAVDSKAAAGDDSGFVVTGNNFYNNSTTPGNHMSVVLNQNDYTGTFDARHNWWGSTTGPGGDGSGKGDRIYGNAQYITDKGWIASPGGVELFSPWASAAYTISTPNFLGAIGLVDVPIQAEDFNQGGQDIAYHDSDSTDNGGTYRSSWVDIESTNDTGGGHDVGWTNSGEWLAYTIDVPVTTSYRFDLRIANPQINNATVHIEIDNHNVTGTIPVPDTGAWTNWQTISSDLVSVAEGVHTIRLSFDGNGSLNQTASVNWLQMTTASAAPVANAPGGMNASTASSSQINLGWNYAGTPVNGFKIQRSTDGVTFTTVAALGASFTSYADGGLAASTTYDYRVIAYNGTGDSAASTTITAETAQSTSAPLTPVGLVATATGASSVALNWHALATPPLTYDIDRSTDGLAFTNVATAIDGAATHWTDHSVLSASSRYFYRIRAVNSFGSSGNSNVASGVTYELATVTYLTNVGAIKSRAGSGVVKPNTSLNGNLITLGGITYAQGLGVNAPSSITFNLAGRYAQFLTTIGLDDESTGGSVDFQVLGDGRLLYDSGIITGTLPASLRIDIAHVQQLTLIVANPSSSNTAADHADWADARVYV